MIQDNTTSEYMPAKDIALRRQPDVLQLRNYVLLDHYGYQKDRYESRKARSACDY